MAPMPPSDDEQLTADTFVRRDWDRDTVVCSTSYRAVSFHDPSVRELEDEITQLKRELKAARAEVFRLRNQQRRGDRKK